MNISAFISKRYFVSRGNKNFINILTMISILIVGVCCMALVIVMSVFNGLEGLLSNLNSTFDPELKIELVKGKTFPYTKEMESDIKSIEGISLVTEVIEDYAYLKYGDAEMVVTMKGMSEEFIEEKRLKDAIVYGDFKLHDNGTNYAIVGQGVQFFLSIVPGNDMNAMQVHYIKDFKQGSLNRANLYSKKSILPAGVFSIQKQFDENYIFVPLNFARELLDYGNKRTSLEIKTNGNISGIRQSLKEVLGSEYKVLNTKEQHADLYKLLKMEKLFVFITFALILAVGSINILFVLSMLAIEKKKDITVLYALGADQKTISQIFLKEGFIISFVGVISGLVLGAIICYLQQVYGFVSMGMQSAVQNHYPVLMNPLDFILIASTVMAVTFIVSYRPARLAVRYASLDNL